MTDYTHIKTALVKEAHTSLLGLRGKVHAQLTGYLAALADAQGDYTQRVQTTTIEAFFKRFFAPKNGTDKLPYYVPWTRTSPGWLKSNLQGSYAPGSPRHGMPDVMHAISDDTKGWEFQDDHASKGLEKLLKGNKIPGYALAIFVLREAGFPVGSKPEDIKEEFRKVMGFHQGDGPSIEKILIDWGDAPSKPFSGPVRVKSA